jgi:carboxyl-terminal processing protease
MATDAAAADEIWRKQLKSSVLGLKLAGKKMPDIEELLLKRYRDQLRRMSQVNSEDVFQLYMNSFTELFDPHTNYLSPRSSENFNMNMRLSLEGIGAVLQLEDVFTMVARLGPAGPAAKQG